MLLTENPYLTIEEVAELLRMHPDTIRRLLRAKRLPGKKVGGGEWRISRELLDKYIKESEDQSDDLDLK